MRTSIKELLDNYQVRRSLKQKQQFALWLRQHANEYGYKIEEQHYKKGQGRNLIVGNPRAAEVILTAHYDTPPNAIFPIMTIVGSIPMYIISQVFVFLPIVMILWLMQRVVAILFGSFGFWSEMVPFFWSEISLWALILLLLWCIQMTIGFANRKNANDNTSGIAVLIALLEDLPHENRSAVCLVFFDDEEKGLVGSRAFNKCYHKEISSKPLINFDCVAHGQHLMFIARKKFSGSKFNEILADVCAGKALIKEERKYVYPSDQIAFKNSVVVAALNKMPVIGYYLSRLHSRFDQKFNVDNIEKLNVIMIEFINKICDDSKL